MASSLLILAIIIFSARGFFLGFVGVIGKAIGLVLGYVIALSYRAEAASWVGKNTTLNVPSMVIEIGCGAALFFATLFTTGFVVAACAGLLKKIIPPLAPLFDKESTAGRVTGAVSNGLLGAGIVLIGIWIYGLLGKASVEPPRLQQVADMFGNSFLNVVKQSSDFSLPTLNSAKQSAKVFSAPTPQPTSNRETISNETTKGTAVIVSETDPNRNYSVENIYQEVAKVRENANSNELMQLLGNEQMQSLLNNPQIQKFAMEQLKGNSAQLGDLSEKTGLSPEQLQELLEKLPSQQ